MGTHQIIGGFKMPLVNINPKAVQKTASIDFTYNHLDSDLQVEGTLRGNWEHDRDGDCWEGDWDTFDMVTVKSEGGTDITLDLDRYFLPFKLGEKQADSVLDDIKAVALQSTTTEFDEE